MYIHKKKKISVPGKIRAKDSQTIKSDKRKSSKSEAQNNMCQGKSTICNSNCMYFYISLY